MEASASPRPRKNRVLVLYNDKTVDLVLTVEKAIQLVTTTSIPESNYSAQLEFERTRLLHTKYYSAQLEFERVHVEELIEKNDAAEELIQDAPAGLIVPWRTVAQLDSLLTSAGRMDALAGAGTLLVAPQVVYLFRKPEERKILSAEFVDRSVSLRDVPEEREILSAEFVDRFRDLQVVYLEEREILEEVGICTRPSWGTRGHCPR